MNAPRLLFHSLLLLLAGMALGGCTVQPQRDSSIPWAQPTPWENSLPGMENNTH